MKRAEREKFTKRELQVLRLVNKGYTNAQIALTLGISPLTVATHRKHLFKKANCHTVWDVVHYCNKNNFR